MFLLQSNVRKENYKHHRVPVCFTFLSVGICFREDRKEYTIGRVKTKDSFRFRLTIRITPEQVKASL